MCQIIRLEGVIFFLCVLICHMKIQLYNSYVGCKYGTCRKLICVSTGKLMSFMFCSEAILFYGHPKGMCPPKSSQVVTQEGKQSLFWGTLFFHFLQHQNTRSVIPMFCANPCVLGWRTKGSSDTDSKAVQRKPVWAVLKVTAFLGCNTKQASCNSD